MKKPKTVLIVDDDPSVSDMLAPYFEKAGYLVKIAGSGFEALEMLKKISTHLILSDVRMPNGTGIDLLKGIEKLANKVPIILMTGFSHLSEEEALAMGAAGYVQKPVRIKKLLSMAEKLACP